MRVLAPGRILGFGERRDELLELAGLDEALRGEHGAQLRGADGGGQGLLAGGEIEHDGDAIVGVEAEQRDD